MSEQKLDVFRYIETASKILEEKRESYTKCAAKIAAFLEKAFFDEDAVVGVTYRVKTGASLKEKIIRNNLYKQYAADSVVRECSDIAGLRMECRFLEDEAAIYERLKTLFCLDAGDGYFYPEGKKHLCLRLGTPQPERQKNGLEIYRIDGFVVLGGEKYNYELQIKSLVNSFWSEIEHKIIYKNKRFMLIDDFVNELMRSINESLVNIDRQLNMLFHRCLDSSHAGQAEAVENMLLGLINELFSRLVEEKAGISVNIKPYSQALVKYILGYSSFANGVYAAPLDGEEAADAAENPPRYGATISRFMSWMRRVDFAAIRVGEEIVFDHPIAYENELQENIGKKFIAEMNRDFFCNTFFHILFSIEVGNDMQDFSSYVRYYARRVGADAKSEFGVVRLKYEIEKTDAGKLLLEDEIQRLAAIK